MLVHTLCCGAMLQSARHGSEHFHVRRMVLRRGLVAIAMNDGDTMPINFEPLSPRDPHEVVGVERGASKQAMKAAYRKRARQLHPDASGDESTAPAFQELVRAFKELCSIKPGSLETHPLWRRLSGLDRYWARELGYTLAYGDETIDGLEEWLIATTKLDDYVDEEGVELPELDPSSLEAEAMQTREQLGEEPSKQPDSSTYTMTRR